MLRVTTTAVRNSAGEQMPTGLLVVRKASGEALEYIKIDMKNLIVTNVSTGGVDTFLPLRWLKCG
jgi:type VI protein secretion system component Hcp